MSNRIEPTQEELDESARKQRLINRNEVKMAVRSNFEAAIRQLQIRSSYDQTIIGNILTSLQIEVEKDIKKLKSITN